MFNSAKKIFYSGCFILLFGVVVPAWIAYVKVEAINNFSPSPLADPVMKVVGNTRKFLLSRVEGLRLRDQVSLWSGERGVMSTPILK